MKLAQDYNQDFEPRFRKGFVILFLLLGLFASRLYYLQIVKGSYYRFFSEENSIWSQKIEAIRGKILDRNGEILASNRPSFNLIVIPQYVVNPQKMLTTLTEKLEIPKEVLGEIWRKRLDLPAYQPLLIKEDLSQDIVAWVRANKKPWNNPQETIDLRGVDIEVKYNREYPEGDTATHLLGYLAEIDSEHLKEYQRKWSNRYHFGDQVGISGIEKQWDLQLKGFDGYQEKVVNAVGREVNYPGISEDLVYKENSHGQHLKLSIDKKLQEVARDSFLNKKGGVVAMDPNTGEVLLLYSAPAFDLNQLASREREGLWGEISSNPKSSLINRVFQGAYPPGSTYKIVTASAALQEGVISKEEELFCPGYIYFGSRKYQCWKAGGHGPVNFWKALIESCDVYFYQMGIRLGVDNLAKYARWFGLGQAIKLGDFEERTGLVPDSEWKLRVRKEPWQPGETLSVAIGQGFNLVTPMQELIMISKIANGGKNVRPYLSKAWVDPDTGYETKITPPVAEEKNDSLVGDETLQAVKKALVGVVAEPRGTAHHLSRLKIPMGGKTGTAQVVSLDKECEGDSCEDHAWFVAFAPAEEPQIAVAVLVEHGGHGSSAAAPIVGKVIQTYLEKQ